MKKISKTEALKLLKESKGRFFTIFFTKSNNQERKINGTWIKDQKEKGLGNYIVRETKLLRSVKKDEWVKSFNINRLKTLKINKTEYKVV
jgi:hypothetical protein